MALYNKSSNFQTLAGVQRKSLTVRSVADTPRRSLHQQTESKAPINTKKKLLHNLHVSVLKGHCSGTLLL